MTKLMKSLFVALALIAASTVPALNAADAVTPNAMTPAGIQEILTDLGYEPTPTSSQIDTERGASSHVVQVQRAKQVHDLEVTLHADAKQITISTRLNPRTNHTGASTVTYLKLLEMNNQMGSAAFAIDANGGLILSRTYDAKSMNHARLKKALDQVVSLIPTSEPAWKAENFPSPVAARTSQNVHVVGNQGSGHLDPSPFAAPAPQ
jgi:hypothetical protein